MSSILEALRELESNRAPAAKQAATPVFAPPQPTPRGVGFFMQTMAGLAVGAFVFGGYLLSQRLFTAVTSDGPVEDKAALSPAAQGTPAATAERPAWLDHAEAPKARVDRGPVESQRRAESAPGNSRSEPAAAEPKPSHSSRPLEIESINYSGVVTQRSVTLRIKGRRVTLGQRESAEGIEVQLITPDGVYVQRGGDVFLVTPSR